MCMIVKSNPAKLSASSASSPSPDFLWKIPAVAPRLPQIRRGFSSDAARENNSLRFLKSLQMQNESEGLQGSSALLLTAAVTSDPP